MSLMIPSLLARAAILVWLSLRLSHTRVGDKGPWIIAICVVGLHSLGYLWRFGGATISHVGTLKANRRARKVFLKWLPWRMKVYFILNGKLKVRGSDGKRYHIAPRDMNAVRAGTSYYCGHPGSGVPVLDKILATYFVLRHDAAYFRQRAIPHL